MENNLNRIREAGLHLAESAEKIRELAEQLRRDVDSLTDRVTAVENEAAHASEDLVDAKEKVSGEQAVQDGRLDTLEN